VGFGSWFLVTPPVPYLRARNRWQRTFVGDQMATTDHDAPRRNTPLDDDTDSLGPGTAAVADKRSPVVDLGESDAGDSVVDLPGARSVRRGPGLPVVPNGPTDSPARRASWSSTAARRDAPPI
jgi:hypothetical protein